MKDRNNIKTEHQHKNKSNIHTRRSRFINTNLKKIKWKRRRKRGSNLPADLPPQEKHILTSGRVLHVDVHRIDETLYSGCVSVTTGLEPVPERTADAAAPVCGTGSSCNNNPQLSNLNRKTISVYKHNTL